MAFTVVFQECIIRKAIEIEKRLDGLDALDKQDNGLRFHTTWKPILHTFNSSEDLLTTLQTQVPTNNNRNKYGFKCFCKLNYS